MSSTNKLTLCLCCNVSHSEMFHIYWVQNQDIAVSLRCKWCADKALAQPEPIRCYPTRAEATLALITNVLIGE